VFILYNFSNALLLDQISTNKKKGVYKIGRRSKITRNNC